MRNLKKALGCCAIAIAITACRGDGSVGDPASMTEPSFDSGFMIGSGQQAAAVDTSAIIPESTTTSITSGDSAERGGFTMGSGN